MTTLIEKGEGWEMRLGKWQASPVEECDHIITDPPYTNHVHKNQRRSGASNGAGEFQEIIVDDLSFAAMTGADELITWALDASRRWVLVWCAMEQFGEYVKAAGGRWQSGGKGGAYVRSCAWIKSNPTPQFSGDRPGMWGEGCAVMHSLEAGALRWNGGGKSGIYAGTSVRGDDRIHETQKPLWLMRAQVWDFTDKGELIWDPYAGSATTGVAAISTGRRFIGHELDIKNFKQAVSRLRAVERGTDRQSDEAGQLTIIDAIRNER